VDTRRVQQAAFSLTAGPFGQHSRLVVRHNNVGQRRTIKVGIGSTGAFEAMGLERECWSSAKPIREIFREAFTRADLPYFNPHSFRNTLVQLGERHCATPEAFKSWSQNLGHEGVLTTLTSYGAVEPARQAEIIRSMWQGKSATDDLLSRIAVALQQAGIVQSEIKS
jgi:hypothetical protein